MLRSFRDSIKACSSNDWCGTGSRKYDRAKVMFPPTYRPEGIQYRAFVQNGTEVDLTKKGVFLPGSMLCLASDNYKSVVFVSLQSNAKSDTNITNHFSIDVKLEDDLFMDTLCPNKSYTMIEPNAYFECYRHVLAAIKGFTEVSFPLKDMIVYFNFDAYEPEYLLEAQDCTALKFCLHEKCTQEKQSGEDNACDCKVFNPLVLTEWPAAEELGLDKQQLVAFKTAITNKVAVIQGPPGTGKTFLGTKIVKALLDNNREMTPIVICCLTNHALDQFLEKIMEYTDNIIRLGHQSQSEKLKSHTLEYLIMALKQHANQSYEIQSTDDDLLKSLAQIQKYSPQLLEQNCGGDYDEVFEELRMICGDLNKELKNLVLCKDDFLQESSLNLIIPDIFKKELEKGLIHGTMLSTHVLEWLCHSRGSALKEECNKRFTKFDADKQNRNEISMECNSIWSLSLPERYKLFYNLRENKLDLLNMKINSLSEVYRKKMILFEGRLPDSKKSILLENAFVIGVTTTGAAKYRHLINSTEPKILIVEEAAEVLESHIIASLSSTHQHLILIGDHKQLRPLPANHELSEEYNLKISMFERLFNNGAPSATLAFQHRMKPCIADLLIQDELYPELKHNPNVYKYEEIKGVKSSLFFLTHSQPENNTSDISSSNNYEASMIGLMAKYLCFQSYAPEQITILATYNAQIRCIKEELKKFKIEGVQLTSVDNYQGEENDVVLVSFVRSNMIGNIGFLKENNRVCVALSRARKGMFCIGNFLLYAQKSNLWSAIVEKLKATNTIGEDFPLICSRHEKDMSVSSIDAFENFVINGCNEICGYILKCGHSCERKCHFNDPEHNRYLCKKPCEQKIAENKKCSRLCFERCKKPKFAPEKLICGHIARRKYDGSIIDNCVVEIQKIKTACNHCFTLPCNTDINKIKCSASISIILPCGHKKSVSCYQSKDIHIHKCDDVKPVDSPCGHTVTVPCCEEIDDEEIMSFCTKSCDVVLNCGHQCTAPCQRCKNTSIHGMCMEKCEEKLLCGHPCSGYCNSPCLPCMKGCLMRCPHDVKCKNRCYRECVPCSKSCARRCSHSKCSKKCFEPCDVTSCPYPCEKIFECKHKCIGLCGDPCPQPCPLCTGSDVLVNHNYVQLEDCDHVIEVNLLQKHIESCVENFTWPDCPECLKSITCNLRFKSLLEDAKNKVIETIDNNGELDKFYYLSHSLFGALSIVPADFCYIEKLIKTYPSKGINLYVVNHNILCLQKMLSIHSLLENHSSYSKYVIRFNVLLSWIVDHMELASYQQMQEIEVAVDQLNKLVIDTIT